MNFNDTSCIKRKLTLTTWCFRWILGILRTRHQSSVSCSVGRRTWKLKFKGIFIRAKQIKRMTTTSTRKSKDTQDMLILQGVLEILSKVHLRRQSYLLEYFNCDINKIRNIMMFQHFTRWRDLKLGRIGTFAYSLTFSFASRRREATRNARKTNIQAPIQLSYSCLVQSWRKKGKSIVGYRTYCKKN